MPPDTSPGLLDDHDARLARVRFRRALTLLVMTLVLPGSAQLVAGSRRVGRIAVRAWLGLAATGAFLVLLGLLWHGLVFWLFSDTLALGLLRGVLLVVAVGWAGLFVDSWRLGQPLGLRQKQRLAMVGLNGVLCLSVAGTLLFASHVVGVQRDLVATMFGGGTVSATHDGRYNVLLLGGDSGRDRWGLRTDSMTVASIDARTGRTILFGLPRNMRDVTFPTGSVMRQQFPHGYDCPDCELNSLATYSADNKKLFAGFDDPAVEATIEGVEGVTGLTINYWAMVNLHGFEHLVDALGGLRLNVRDRIPIGGVGGPVTGYIEPGIRRLDGFHTLWFARSRETADDYSRMARQKCVMSAMLNQLDPATVVTKFEKIASAGKEVITTDLPASELPTFMRLGLKARSQPVKVVSFVPPLVNTSDPDIAAIHARVQSVIDSSQGRRTPAASTRAKTSRHHARGKKAGFSSAEQAGTTGGAIGSMHDGYEANQAADLSQAC